ncbi:MAG: glutamate--cysteine ligase [Desulfocapsaceae bacterium]|jgi:glutamate--cysteine ligase|nr:glutamate--cysteine ligase [Desulfocapsaceae bacterium]
MNVESIFTEQLEQLAVSNAASLLKGTLRGIEKEGLRVDQTGSLSQKKHPHGLGSALTNAHITTDFSESLLELITPVFDTPEGAVTYLENLHKFTYHHLDEELIWAASMPCRIEDAKSIPIAWFGSSNSGLLKHIYRVGLKHRYGKMMQTLAGIHYNYSLPDDFWQAFQDQLKNRQSLQTFRSSSYFRLIRNFRRHSWLLLYLFGASPALADSFLQGKAHNLQAMNENTLYLPYATSLRMSDFGYSPDVQSDLNICFNHLKTYIDSLNEAIHTSYEPYKKIGIKVDGRYRQLSDTILQIENEYYSDIRPKRVPHAGEKPLHALLHRGVQYVEVRHTDINPFAPVGIDAEQIRFLDTFLLSCLLMNHEEVSPDECKIVTGNTRKVITSGRQPGLMLNTLQGSTSGIEAAKRLLKIVASTAELLDNVHSTTFHSSSVAGQIEKLEDSSLTPSARLLAALKESGLEYTDWVLLKSREYRDYFQNSPLQPAALEEQTREATESIARQKQIEATDTLDFDQFLTRHLAS